MNYLWIEIKKLLRSKIWILTTLFLTVFLFGFVALCDMMSAGEAKSLNENFISLDLQYEGNISNLEKELDKYRNDSETTKRIKEIIAYTKSRRETNSEMLQAMKDNNRKQYLQGMIKDGEITLKALDAGFLQGVRRENVEDSLSFNQYLSEHGIEPILTRWDVNFVNLFFLFIKNIYIILFPVLTLLLSTAFSSEYKNRTIKIVWPLRRRSVFLYKSLSAFFACSAMLSAFILLLFAASGIAGGTGSLLYPVQEAGELSYITAGAFFARAAVLFFVNSMLLCSAGVLLSLLVRSSLLCSLICCVTALVPVIVKSPYTDLLKILTSSAYPVYLVALFLPALLFFLLGAAVFEKKDLWD